MIFKVILSPTGHFMRNYLKHYYKYRGDFRYWYVFYSSLTLNITGLTELNN